MKAFECPICSSILDVELHYQEIRKYVASYEFKLNTTYLATPSDIEHAKEDDHYILYEIILSCPEFDSGECDFEHVIELSKHYDTLEALFQDAEIIIEKELSKKRRKKKFD